MRYVFALDLHKALAAAAADECNSGQDEKDRMDIYHKIMEVARRGKLHEAPIPVHSADPPRILDLGCGTGIWAIDMAEYVRSFRFQEFA